MHSAALLLTCPIEKGPAVEYSNGTESWYKNGLLHRDDSPAIEYFDGSKEWYKNGKLHREEGPAWETKTFNNKILKRWFFKGTEYPLVNSDSEWSRFVKTLIFS